MGKSFANKLSFDAESLGAIIEIAFEQSLERLIEGDFRDRLQVYSQPMKVKTTYGYPLTLKARHIPEKSSDFKMVFNIQMGGTAYIISNYGTGSKMDKSNTERLEQYKAIFDWNGLRDANGGAITGRSAGNYKAVDPFSEEIAPVIKTSSGSSAGMNLEGGINKPSEAHLWLEDGLNGDLFNAMELNLSLIHI